jgi:hypothetical protein
VIEQRGTWDRLQAQISAAAEEWRQEHPAATLTEIERRWTAGWWRYGDRW